MDNNDLTNLEETRELIALQKQEQELKAKELIIHEQEIKIQANYASEALQAQLNDRNAERKYNSKLQFMYLFVITLIIVVLLSFLSFALYLGYAKLVFEAMQILISVGVGAIGGYGYGISKK